MFGGGFNGGFGANQTGPGVERAPLVEGNSLKDAPVSIRRGFVQKVYGILCAQLILTMFVAGVVMHVGKTLVQNYPGLSMALLFASVTMSFTMMFIFMCCPHTMRRSPLNYLLLLLFTFAKAVMVGCISLNYTRESILIALAITCIVVVGLTILACCSTVDFTGAGPYLGCGVMVLMGFGFFMFISSMFGLGSSPAFQAIHLLYAAFGALLFSAFLVYDTQLILGGQHRKHEFCIDDYAMAAISIYIDIIELFVFMVQIVGKRDGS
jgi:FtsH-binding integral membrane protein